MNNAKNEIEDLLSAADEDLGRLIKFALLSAGPLRVTREHASPFIALLRSIIYQQLSTKAAATIYGRFRLLVKGELTPKKVSALTQEKMCGAGLSKSKAKYVHNLAAWFSGNPKIAKNLNELPDDDIIAALTSISGIGVWSAHMFLIFYLERLDIMPTTDLGIRRGFQLTYGMRKLAAPQYIHRKALRWQPYRSIASLYLWHAANTKFDREAS